MYMVAVSNREDSKETNGCFLAQVCNTGFYYEMLEGGIMCTSQACLMSSESEIPGTETTVNLFGVKCIFCHYNKKGIGIFGFLKVIVAPM